MNKSRRKELERATALLQDAALIIQTVLEEEQEAFDNLSGNLQQSPNGQKMEESVSALEEAVSYCGDAVSSIESASA